MLLQESAHVTIRRAADSGSLIRPSWRGRERSRYNRQADSDIKNHDRLSHCHFASRYETSECRQLLES